MSDPIDSSTRPLRTPFTTMDEATLHAGTERHPANIQRPAENDH